MAVSRPIGQQSPAEPEIPADEHELKGIEREACEKLDAELIFLSHRRVLHGGKGGQELSRAAGHCACKTQKRVIYTKRLRVVLGGQCGPAREAVP
jgi:hypothetical protein